MSPKFCKGCGGAIEDGWRYCSACGYPTGLVPPAPPSSTAVWVVVAIAAVFCAIAVTGIVAAIAIPNFVAATQRAKQKRTMADIRAIGTAVEAYAVDHNTYPRYGASIDELRELVSPTYIRTFTGVDGWNREIRYHCLDPRGDNCMSYAFQSAGKDGQFDDFPSEIPTEATNNFDCDILWANGQFVWYPEGTIRGGR